MQEDVSESRCREIQSVGIGSIMYDDDDLKCYDVKERL
jgi:hypothetical protein